MIEIIDSKIIMTYSAGLPLVRYDTKDCGGVLKPNDVEKFFSDSIGKSYYEAIKKKSIPSNMLPFVYVYGRSDSSASIYGVNIHPEIIKEALAGEELIKLFSGKFVMRTNYDKKGNQNLDIVLEMRKNFSVSGQNIAEISGIIVKRLIKICSEYGKLYKAMGERVEPKISLRSFGDQEYFSSANKHKYIIK
jgi:phenylacetate-coenzyme A ligase PaaK-like adenylate-forming protein